MTKERQPIDLPNARRRGREFLMSFIVLFACGFLATLHGSHHIPIWPFGTTTSYLAISFIYISYTFAVLFLLNCFVLVFADAEETRRD